MKRFINTIYKYRLLFRPIHALIVSTFLYLHRRMHWAFIPLSISKLILGFLITAISIMFLCSTEREITFKNFVWLIFDSAIIFIGFGFFVIYNILQIYFYINLQLPSLYWRGSLDISFCINWDIMTIWFTLTSSFMH